MVHELHLIDEAVATVWDEGRVDDKTQYVPAWDAAYYGKIALFRLQNGWLLELRVRIKCHGWYSRKGEDDLGCKLLDSH